ncbi:hypothetical protein COCCADRAFT_92570 [Bipolaris zeicola 26-R-13]|uniref:J domain-containing protein n=2 Tax=Bipolaris TaxID=33194 RepID=W6Y9X2_COCC2|nr:uncharacterized protein COCCADRAFT_92570 [Bipolaris zeicola 26-R-13]EUC34768.1 hypothetical protein COCCADRAFT_92570 [Bipolaris zeicola 26-R-13]
MTSFLRNPSLFSCGSVYAEDMRRRSERQWMPEPRIPFRSRSLSPAYTNYTYAQEKGNRRPYNTETRRVPSSPFSLYGFAQDKENRRPSTAESRSSTSSPCSPEYYLKQPRTRTHRTYQAEDRVPSPKYKCEYEYEYESVEFIQMPWGTSYQYSYGYPADPPTPPHSPRTGTYTSSGRSRKAHYTTEERRPRSVSPKPRRQRKSSSSHQYPRSPPSESYSSYRESPPVPEGIQPRKDLYAVLKISRSATTDDIKKAYRALSLKWHPDRCASEDRAKATKKMAEINQAKEILCDQGKKEYYDHFGLISSDL